MTDHIDDERNGYHEDMRGAAVGCALLMAILFWCGAAGAFVYFLSR